jgi:hypothetical protein
MCLYIDPHGKIKWPKYGKGFKIFWKRFNISYKKLLGYCQTDYTFNQGWNYPTTLYVEKTGDIVYGGCFHVLASRCDNPPRYDYSLPVICHKADLIAIGTSNDIAFKKIYIPNFLHYVDKRKNLSNSSRYYKKIDDRKIFYLFKKELYAQSFWESNYNIFKNNVCTQFYTV